MTNKFTVGSSAFFSSFEDFVPHDKDTLILVDNPTEFKVQRQIRLRGNCIFEWKRMTTQEFINYHKIARVGIFIGKFLVPEFAEEIGLTIEDLKQLDFLIPLLDEKHEYEKLIYNYYIENNKFKLTDEQLKIVYKNYKSKRTRSF